MSHLILKTCQDEKQQQELDLLKEKVVNLTTFVATMQQDMENVHHQVGIQGTDDI